MKSHLLPAVRLTLICLLFFSGLYTALVWGAAQLAPNSGKGEVVSAGGKVYFRNIAQRFTQDRYFSSRPSAVGYNAAGAGGSNKGPSNPDYLAEVAARIDTFMAHNPGVERSTLPSDLVTASGAGLDPNLSLPAARVQVTRIARARGLQPGTVETLIRQYTEAPLLGFLGTEKVNVLELNLALDALH
jgi:K+-transporting ATPase ATPase C chain